MAGLTRVVETEGAGMLFAVTIMTALVTALPGMGVRLAVSCRVTAMDADGGIITADGERHRGDTVVVAAGAWVDRLVPSLRGIAVPSRQAVVYLARPADLATAWAAAPVMLNRSRAGGSYTLPPRRGTHLKVGDHMFSRRGNPDDDRVARPEDLERLLPALATAFRGIGRCAVLERRACFYTVSEDERFIVRTIGAKAWVIGACSGHGFSWPPPWPRRSRRPWPASARPMRSQPGPPRLRHPR